MTNLATTKPLSTHSISYNGEIFEARIYQSRRGTVGRIKKITIEKPEVTELKAKIKEMREKLKQLR